METYNHRENEYNQKPASTKETVILLGLPVVTVIVLAIVIYLIYTKNLPIN